MTKTTTNMTKGSIGNWEKGKLGLSEEHAVEASPEEMAELDSALELKLISIRLQKQLIAKLKFIAAYNGVGYQPLIRDIMNRFASHEIVTIARKIQEEKEAEATLTEDDSPAARFMRDCA
jgi:hypothetical protein